MKENTRWNYLIIFLLLFITGLHYFTQSNLWVLHDFYRRLYYIPIILAAFKFRIQGGFAVSIAVFLLYIPHMIIYFGVFNIELFNQLLESVMFVVVGLITGYLVEQDYRRGKELEYQIIKLTNLENYTNNILQSIDSGVMAFDINGQLRSVNRQIIKVLGTKSEITKFIEQETIIEGINKIIKGTETVVKINLNYIGKEKNDLFLDITIYPIENLAKVKEGAVLVMEDVTTVKKLENQVKRTERLVAIGQLASGIAHEIRNPLGIIKTISQTIKEDVEDVEIKEGLEIIEHEIERANRVIKSLLDFAKPNKMKIQNIDLSELLGEIMMVTQKIASHQKIVLNWRPRR
ncbi:histidine kinase dimerization/phospho-acceptor domain-containing protein [Anaerobranca gottschalkii]|uniref:histidine kinase n=1 Tax=Anaerobranca gottschalkii DSM 13577 TaxID=1120990 RepID=A0A1I0B1I6_9FIRM|nr:histidine kinase dimerization/phospho-acceptor domain-containing protein [Anaerobranca gottschalkii]SET00700.1 His Kinase A (phospho-acceptor) domain-containing protein [Anaerobranca gottschalkii DSM 13577]